MCTLTWRAAGDGYDLFFNRDERDTRAPEVGPAPGATSTGVRYLAPADGDHRGTWLVLNEHGMTVCLLNDYPRGMAEIGRESRGRIPLICAGCTRAADVPRLLCETVVLTDYAPFHLVAVDVSGTSGAVHLRWDGRTLHEASAPEFLTSSSYEPERVRAERAARFTALTERSTEVLRAFHYQHDAEAGAESVLMRRPDASTRSVCAVHVRGAVRELVYEPVSWSGMNMGGPMTLRV